MAAVHGPTNLVEATLNEVHASLHIDQQEASFFALRPRDRERDCDRRGLCQLPLSSELSRADKLLLLAPRPLIKDLHLASKDLVQRPAGEVRRQSLPRLDQPTAPCELPRFAQRVIHLFTLPLKLLDTSSDTR